MTEKTAEKQHATRGRPFQPGQSGNPDGRPKGARNAATVAAEVLLDGEAEAITRKCVELAKEGDTVALRLCLERILPAPEVLVKTKGGRIPLDSGLLRLAVIASSTSRRVSRRARLG